MSDEAASYQAGTLGARSNRVTRAGQAPSLRYTGPDGAPVAVRFDGYDEAAGELIDRKISVTTFPKSQKQALRQSEALAHAGYRGVWEVPTAAEAARADRMFERLGIRNITTRVVPR
jgi:filamentous hemagglutinin